MDFTKQEVSPDIALRLILKYKNRKNSGISWGQVERDIKNQAHPKCFLVDRKKLRFWETRGSINQQAYEAIQCFITSEEFLSIVPEAINHLSPIEELILIGEKISESKGYGKMDNKLLNIDFSRATGYFISKSLRTEGLIDTDNDSHMLDFVLITPLPSCNFAIVNFYQAQSIDEFPLVDPKQIYSGFLFFNQDSNNNNHIVFHVWNRFNNSLHELSFSWSVFENSISSSSMIKKSAQEIGSISPHENPYNERELHLNNSEKNLVLVFSNHQLRIHSNAPNFQNFDSYSIDDLPYIFDKIKFSVLMNDA